jgi:DNA-binding NarL/FixJ family response regulator
MSDAAPTERLRPADANGPRAAGTPLPLRILVVCNDMVLRLKLADLLAAQCPGAVLDTCTARAVRELGTRLVGYAAAIPIVDFAAPREAGDPLAIVSELRACAKGLAITVIGRGGDERSALAAVRAGAFDYWSLHAVDAAALVAALRVQVLGPAVVAPTAPASLAAALAAAGYRLLKELASTPKATLYLAASSELGAPVALKVHRHAYDAAASDEETGRFLRECRLISQLNHPSIADVYDFGVTVDCHWLAMEYFPCGSLKARLQHPLSEAEAVAYAARIGTALAQIHAAGIVHRDLTPANIMLRADDSLALIDFGLARPALAPSSVTSPQVRVGSPAYMAPEQIDGVPPDGRCDLYALGVLMYEMFTGSLPFRSESLQELLEQQRAARPPRLPPALARYQPILDALLGKRPSDRPASAGAFLDMLATVGAEPQARRSK